jgi:DNA-binding XRE family transcriptional regulator
MPSELKRDDIALVSEGRAAAEEGLGRVLRRRARLSQRQMALLVGVSQPTIQRWETGKSQPSPTQAVAYTRALREIERVTSRG